jgi:hypothetical protein
MALFVFSKRLYFNFSFIFGLLACRQGELRPIGSERHGSNKNTEGELHGDLSTMGLAQAWPPGAPGPLPGLGH